MITAFQICSSLRGLAGGDIGKLRRLIQGDLEPPGGGPGVGRSLRRRGGNVGGKPYKYSDHKETTMAIIKVIEVLAQSNQSWEDAAQSAVRDAAKTVKNIKSIYIKEFEAVVDGDKITQYRIDGKISFEVQG